VNAWRVGDFFPAAFNCPHEIERHGALGDGGKWVCGLSRVRNKHDCVVYSFGVVPSRNVDVYQRIDLIYAGIGYESSFEAEILRNTQHCQIWGYDYTVKSFSREIPRESSHRTHFKPYDLGSEDKHGPEDKIPVYTLDTLMKINGSYTYLFISDLGSCHVRTRFH